jgi:hypothetical protein
MVEQAIKRHLPQHQLEIAKVAEDSERQLLRALARDAAL